ncbi:GntR family transcriptional regulator [Nocardioides jiangxiensis]|uniref:GntR family transcriptional regulator n=1 Tax=Nocardioides jiangxiensis TaxID=3064524 RepID=A0ABT9B3M7_9ACTN|nr:GntR family transcriptional regulator [Nocardioides sp. WY-20]MDO7867753.1 GntR family transcriptional regulator [Nocardioides sp. WY-20]
MVSTVGEQRVETPKLKYVQVRDHLRALLADADPGMAVPSERELVQQFGVARMTVRQAVDALVAEGLLERSPGRGTFVAEPVLPATGIQGFTEDMRRRGVDTDSITLMARVEKANAGIARALGLTAGDPVIHWRRIRRADGSAVCVEDTYLNEVMLPGFLQPAMPPSLYAVLDRRALRPTWAEDVFTAALATEDDAALLGVEPGDPVLHVSRRALHRNRPIAVSRSVYVAALHSPHIQYTER